jgi:hypothetical protein
MDLHQAGKALGSAKSPAKAAAAKKNGQLGGRPRGSVGKKESDREKK